MRRPRLRYKGNDTVSSARIWARDGDSAAFEDLIRPYEGRIYQLVLRITRNPDDAADVYQEALVAAFEKLDGFRGSAAFGTWLHRIAVNCALIRRRAPPARTATAPGVIERPPLVGCNIFPAAASTAVEL